MVRPSPQFFKYIKDVKTGNVKIDPVPDIYNRAKGGVIHPNFISLISDELKVTSLVTSSVHTAITSDSVKSRVITSPFTSYQSRNPPIPRLPSVSLSLLFLSIIVLGRDSNSSLALSLFKGFQTVSLVIIY